MFQVYHNYTVPLISVAVAVLIAICYSSGLYAPFYLDDFSSITENPSIVNVDWHGIWAQYASRIVGYATFAANIALIDASSSSLRLVNIVIHIMAAVAVFFVTRATLVGNAPETSNKSFFLVVAALASIVFAIHPLNTSAVTYIVQRLASLAALFYIFTVYAYIRSRNTKNIFWWTLCVSSTLLALLTKQNTVTLVITLYLAELIIIRRVSPRTLIFHLLSALAIATSLVLGIYFMDLGWSVIDNLSRETLSISRFDYFYAQLAVIGQYITTFLYPYNQMLDYGESLDYWSNQNNLFWAAFHMIVILTAIAIVQRRPSVSFWILFYYIALSIESSIIPIRDLIFEHRSYLPNVALSFLTSYSVICIYNKIQRNWQKIAFYVVILGLLGTLLTRTYSRNAEWSNPYAFFKAEVKRNNGFWRSRNELASLYISDGQLSDALALLNIAELNESSHPSLLINALNISVQQKNVALSSQIIELFGEKLKGSHYRYKSRFYSLAGQHYMRVNQMPKALDYLQKALTLRPNTVEVLANLGIANALSGNFDEAEKLLLDASLLQPNSDKLKKNLKVVEKLRIRSLN